MSDLTGQVVAGYPLEKLLSKGSYEQVYQAKTSGAPVAIKILRDELRGDAALNTAISRGWDATRGVNHPNIVTRYSVGVIPVYGAYCMEEIIGGKTMRQMCQQGNKIGWRDLIILAEQLFDAVKALHGNGKFHGEISPSNLLITQDQDLKLDGAGGLTMLDRVPVDFMKGNSTGYLAPEVIQGSLVSVSSDIFSGGACLYFILAAQDPFPGDDAAAVARLVLERKPTALSAYRDDIPPEAEEFISRLMAKDPTQRYGSVEDVIADLQRLKNGQAMAPLRGGKPPVPGRFPKPPGTKSDTGLLLPRRSSPQLAKVGSSNTLDSVKSNATRVFGRLDTHVKSTIARSDQEKQGDDYYRQGQLPLALKCWKDAFENEEPHTALKVKVELAEKEIKRESYNIAIEEARHRLETGDFKGAIARAREAMLSAHNEQQRQQAVNLEAQANQGILQAGKSSTIKFVVIGIVFVVAAIVAWKMFGGRQVGGDDEPLVPTPKTPADAGPAPKNTGYKSVNVAGASVMPPPSWTSQDLPGALAGLSSSPQGDGSHITMKVTRLPDGAIQGERDKLIAALNLQKPQIIVNLENFVLIDGHFRCAEIGFRYPDKPPQSIRYYFVVEGPSKALALVEFDGPEKAFTPETSREMEYIIKSWSYQR